MGSAFSKLPGVSVRRRTPLLRASILAALAALLFSGAGGFVLFVARLPAPGTAPAEQADAIVVLTGGAQRVEEAMRLLERGVGRRLLITGVNERTSPDQIARLTPDGAHLLSCCVDLDYQARNTAGNALETRRWAQANAFRSLVVVTSNYHMPRSLLELSHALPGVRLIPYSVVAEQNGQRDEAADGPGQSPALFRLLLTEYFKYVAASIRAALP